MSDSQTTAQSTRWGKNIFRAMIGVNAALAGLLIFNAMSDNTATAQTQSRLPSEYLMIPGEVSGSPQSIIYVIDTTNDQLSALTFDSAGNEVRTMRPIDLGRAFSGGTGNTGRKSR